MGYYKNQIPQTLIQQNTLTASYDDNNASTSAGGFNVITVYIEYTPTEDNSSILVQVEAGIDDSNLYPKISLIDEDISGTSTGKSHILEIPSSGAGVMVKKRFLVEIADLKMRVSLKETVSSTFGTGKINILKNEQ